MDCGALRGGCECGPDDGQHLAASIEWKQGSFQPQERGNIRRRYTQHGPVRLSCRHVVTPALEIECPSYSGLL
jgi:hypothetical protein